MPFTPEKRRAWQKKYDLARRSKKKAFVAIDSEGVSYGEKITLENGDIAQAQRTIFWGAGNEANGTNFLSRERSATNGIAPYLSSEEIIDWLLDLPREFTNSIFVWFGSSYDATQIFADLPYEKAWELQRGEPFENNGDISISKRMGRYVLWKGYAFSYIKQKCLKIGELRDRNKPRDAKGNLKFKRQIVIYDVFGFFQSSFLKAAGSIPGAMTAKELSIIKEGKKQRADFVLENINEMMRYTTAEIIVLARVMEALRGSFESYQLKLTRWQGAGSIAAALFKLHKTTEHFAPLHTRDLPIEQEWAHRAFFGGRIECLKQGATTDALHSYDVRSAYPFHMSRLPSMLGGTFYYAPKPPLEFVKGCSPLSMFHIIMDIDTDDAGPLSLNKIYGRPGPDFYPLPYRDEKGRITFGPHVNGIYMQAEALAALEWVKVWQKRFVDLYGVNFPVRFEIKQALLFTPMGQSAPFEWLEAMYRERRAVIKESERKGEYNLTEKVIKLGINSAYGKTAQSVGSVGEAPKTACPWIAAAITSGTRAQLLRAALTAPPRSIVAFQTDGIISTKKLNVELGSKLGEWEYEAIGGPGAQRSIFVQPGIYSFEKKAKHRGIKLDLLGVEKFETWLEAKALPAWARGVESVAYPYRYYVTLGAAVASRERFKICGFWVDGERYLNLNNLGFKRAPPAREKDRLARAEKLVDTLPKPALFHDEIDELPLSAIYKPEWLEPDLAAQSELETLNEEIALSKLGEDE